MITPDRRPIIMGILNVTPDSFSDGGCWTGTDTAVERALRMVEEGADIIDIGGESTRPGAARISAAIQIERVVPVIKAVIKSIPSNITISIDTTLAQVARAAIDAGALMINDISAGRDDVYMLRLAAQCKTRLVLMHMQGAPATMQQNPVYGNVVEEVRAFLLERAAVAKQAGVQDEQIILDPGIGFGKTLDHNMELMNNLHRFTDTGYPVLLGASRKRFLKAICIKGQHDTLVGASCATTALGVLAGVSHFRVHDVSDNRQTADVIYGLASSELKVANHEITQTMDTDCVYKEEEVRARLQRELPEWLYAEGHIRRVCATTDWIAAVNLVNRISPLAEAAWHHPDIEVGFGKVVVSLRTHTSGGITDKDFDLANSIEQLLVAK